MENKKPIIRHRKSTSEFVKQSGLSAVTLWRKSKEDPEFPKAVCIGGKKLYFQDEMTIWIEANENDFPPHYNLDVNADREEVA